MEAWLESMLTLLALPKFGLSTVFVVAFISATLLPLGSEPAVFGLIKLNPELFWPAVLVATAGNTLGGVVTYWMGYGAERAYERVKHHKPPDARALRWLERWARKAACCHGCRSSVTRCAPSPAGSSCRSGPASSTWASASSPATSR